MELMKKKNALDNLIETMGDENHPETIIMADTLQKLQFGIKKIAEQQAMQGFKCYYCGRTAQDLLDENVFDPRLYDTDNESKTNCFLCREHGMYNMVDHIEDPIKKEECLKRFSINHPYADERNKKIVEAIKRRQKK